MQSFLPRKVFILGTDTGIGKTYVTVLLQQWIRALGKSVLAIKPIASDCPSGKSEDALALLAHNSITLPYAQLNPFVFKAAIAPHLAAQRLRQTLTVEGITKACKFAFNTEVDTLLIEGCGGLQVPLNDTETQADLVSAWGTPVILIVGLRLGCLNHSLLTVESLALRKIPLFGWIANHLDPSMQAMDENILSLKNRIKAPLLGIVSYQAKRADFALSV